MIWKHRRPSKCGTAFDNNRNRSAAEHGRAGIIAASGKDGPRQPRTESRPHDELSDMSNSRFIAALDLGNVTRRRILPVSYTHLRAHETGRNLVCRLLL